jgi:hypothetical protein
MFYNGSVSAKHVQLAKDITRIHAHKITTGLFRGLPLSHTSATSIDIWRDRWTQLSKHI